MHSLLESYLSEVAAHLGPLPIKQRNEELREMRQHLLNAVTVNRELGQSEEDAAANAVMQFGAAGDVGQDTMTAWKREERLNKRSFWGASVSVTAFSWASINVLEKLPIVSVEVTLHYAVYLLAGVLSGLFFPKRSTLGAGTAAAVWLILLSVPIIVGWHWVSEPTAWIEDYIEFAALAVAGALIGSRSRLAWSRRGRQVRS